MQGECRTGEHETRQEVKGRGRARRGMERHDWVETTRRCNIGQGVTIYVYDDVYANAYAYAYVSAYGSMYL